MRRHRRLVLAAVGSVAAVTVLGACASLPSSGPVPVSGLGGTAGQPQPGIQFVPAPPGPNWGAQDIVNGFVIASASADNNYAVAREYLARNFAWTPTWAATVVDDPPEVSLPTVSSHVTGGPPTAQVNLTSRHLSTLEASHSYEAGHLLVQSGSHRFKFVLTQIAGQWRIDGIYTDGKPTPKLLLLTLPDFRRDYQARNLYFFPANQSENVLIPDPVFIPEQAGLLGDRHLVDALRGPRQAGWLNDATRTALPPGTTFSIQVNGIKAVVNLGGAAAKASQLQLKRMAAQLVWTLTSESYGASPGIRSVVMQVNHKDWAPPGWQQPLLPKYFASWVPLGPTGPLYYQVASASAEPQVRAWTAGASPAPVELPKSLGQGSFSTIAVSPNSPIPSIGARSPTGTGRTFAGCRGRNVYLAPLGRGAPTIRQTLSVGCTSLSWAGPVNLSAPGLIAPAGHEILMLAADGPSGEAGQTVVVTPAPALAGGTVTWLSVASDGVRAAMIVRTKTGVKIMIAAISQTASRSNTYLGQSEQVLTVGSDISNPLALTWWGPDHLLVVSQPAHGSAQLSDVPLDGGASDPIVTPAGLTSVAASGSSLVVETTNAGSGVEIGPSQYQIWTAPILNGPSPVLTGQWQRIAAQSFSPVFAG